MKMIRVGVTQKPVCHIIPLLMTSTLNSDASQHPKAAYAPSLSLPFCSINMYSILLGGIACDN